MPTGKPAQHVAARGRGRKKTLLLDQALLDRARQALGVRTETDTVRQALAAALRREQQVQGIRTLATLGPIDPARID
jgi:hypothetical protein